LIILLLWIA